MSRAVTKDLNDIKGVPIEVPESEPDKGTPPEPAIPYSGPADVQSVNRTVAEWNGQPASNAGGKRKGPRKPRSPAKTVVFVERLFSRFTLEQRCAMYQMLSSVTEADEPDGKDHYP